MELQVVFDRADRLYQLGDIISGNVVLQPDPDCSYSEIWVTYRWRTHGRGNRDQGSEERLSLAAETPTLMSAERTKFPFRFEAPGGPVTYHGHYLNVDWYLTGHAKSGLLHHAKNEQDFLLVAEDRSGAVVAGDEEARHPVDPAPPTEVRPSPHGLRGVEPIASPSSGSTLRRSYWLLVLLGLLPCVFSANLYGWIADSVRSPYRDPLLALAAIALLAVLLVIIIMRQFQPIEVREVRVEPAVVNAGSEVRCHFSFTAKRPCHLGNIAASITAREQVVYMSGTNPVRDIHVVSEESCTKPIDADLSPRRQIAFDCALPVGQDAPASFSSKSNALEWIVTMKAELKGWPDWSKSFPIIVLPYRLSD